MRLPLNLTLVGVLSILLPSVTHARPTPTQVCESAKLKAQAAFAKCRLTADAAYAKAPDVAKRDAAYAKCESQLADAFTKAEAKAAKAGATCPRTGDVTFVNDLLQSCTTTARNSAAGPYCGDGTVDPDETCDGNCPTCAAPPSACYALASGSAGTCDLVCNPPVLSCIGTADGCCPYQPQTGCGQANDADCLGPSWSYLQWYTPISWSSCSTIRVYGVQAGGSYLFTLCVPPGASRVIGDPVITTVVDNNSFEYAVGNDDCSSTSAIPNLAGWDCTNQADHGFAACSSNDSGGLIARSGASRLDVTVCGNGGSAGSGNFYIWYNAVGNTLNPG
jgi:hypothetical protein